MLRKAARLPHKVFTGRPKRRINFDFGSISFYEGSGQAAVIVSKRVFKRAVDRNRLRRRVLHALKKVPLPFSLVVYPTKDAATVPFTELERALGALSRSR
jgi:ribonuclease P protein component